MAIRDLGSSPVVGSSKKIIGGVAIKLTARSRRRRIPPEYDFTVRLPALTKSNSRNNSSALAIAEVLVRRYNLPIMIKFSRPVKSSSTLADCPVNPMFARTSSD